jgi:hypothetical protein
VDDIELNDSWQWIILVAIMADGLDVRIEVELLRTLLGHSSNRRLEQANSMAV